MTSQVNIMPNRAMMLLPAILHGVIALGLVIFADIRLPQPPSDLGWSILMPNDLLWANLFESLLYLHAQPPLFNIFVAFHVNIFGDNWHSALHVSHVLLGMLAAALEYRILLHLIGGRRLSLILSCLMQLSISLYLYEAYPAYTHLTYTLIVLALWSLAELKGQTRWYVFIICINAIVLTRTLFHPIFLCACLSMVAIAAQKKRWRILAVCLLLSLPTGLWLVKNVVLFDFVGTSSWSGQNLWRIASRQYSDEELSKLVEVGLLEPMVVDVASFDTAFACIPYGFEADSPISTLSNNDRHNTNYIAVSQVYLDNSLRLIRYNPGRYAISVLEAYLHYTAPPSLWWNYLFVSNAERVKPYFDFQTQIVERLVIFSIPTNPYIVSTATLWLPLLLAIYLSRLIRLNRWSWRRWLNTIQSETLVFFCFSLVVYTTLVSILAEIGENMRFRYLIYPALCFLIVAILKGYPKLRRERNSRDYQSVIYTEKQVKNTST